MIERVPIADETLRRVAELVAQSMRRDQAQRLVRGTPTPIIFDDYAARFGDLAVISPAAALTVSLPPIGPADIGKSVFIANVTGSSNRITLRPPPGASINGSASLSISEGYAIREALAVSRDTYLLSVVVDGQSYISGVGGWKHLPVAGPAGMPAPLACWQLDRTADALSDRSGNGHTLTSFSGFSGWVNRSDLGMAWTNVTAAGRLYAAASASLQLLGAVTAEVLFALENTSAVETVLLAVGTIGAADTEANNSLIQVAASASTNAISLFQETGSGVNCTGGTPPLGESYVVPTGELHLVSYVRQSDGRTYDVYVNGELAWSGTWSAAPTGGGNSYAFLGYNSATPQVTIASARIFGAAASASQVAESYRQVRGLS